MDIRWKPFASRSMDAYVTQYWSTDGFMKEWSCYAADVTQAMWKFHYEMPSLGDVRLQMTTVRKDLLKGVDPKRLEGYNH